MKSAVAMRVELLAITNAVMLRAGGASSTPAEENEPKRQGVLDRPPARTMTAKLYK
jgi:hypothetical protein